MPRLDRYLLSIILRQTALFALVLVALYWVNRTSRLFEQLIGGGQSLEAFLGVTLLGLPNALRAVLPFAAFLATLQAGWRLVADSEIVAARSCGLSTGRLLRPAWTGGLVLLLLASFLAHWAEPRSRALLEARLRDVTADVVTRFLRPGRFEQPGRGVTVYVGEVRSDGTLERIFIEDAREPGRRITYTAGRAIVTGRGPDAQLMMLEGQVQSFDSDRQALSLARFEELSLALSRLYEAGARRRRSPREFDSLKLLAADPATQAATGLGPGALRLEVVGRLGDSLEALVAPALALVFLLAGEFSRFGPGRQLGAAVVAMVLVQLGRNLARDAIGDRPELWPIALAPLALAALGVVMIAWFADRPFPRGEARS